MSKGMQIIGFKALAGSVAAKQCWRSIGDLQSRERPARAQPGKQSVKSCGCLIHEVQRATKCTRSSFILEQEASNHGEIINDRQPRL